MSASLAILTVLATQAPECTALPKDQTVLLVTTASDDGLLLAQIEAERTLRRALAADVKFVNAADATSALEREGGEAKRAATYVEVRSLIARAEERFRELDTEEALEIIAKATAQLAPVHQHPGATELLAHAHFLAAAIYLARDRVDAARQRMSRALDLDPDIAPPRHRYAPQVLAELAAVRAGRSVREVGRLEVRLRNEGLRATVYIDGGSNGLTPLVTNTLGAGRHQIRVAAPGYASWVSTIVVERGHDVRLDVTLVDDPEQQAIDDLAHALDRGDNIRPTLALLEKRSGAAHVIVAKLELASHLDATGTATIAVEFVTSTGGHARSVDLSAASLVAALRRASTCQNIVQSDVRIAPAIIGHIVINNAPPGPVPEPTPIWDRPWFWAVCAVATIAATGTVVAIRSAQGPPEAVGITLVPRP